MPTDSKFPVDGALLDGVIRSLPVVVFQLDADGVFVESVGAGLKRLGLAQRQVVGVNALEAFPTGRPYLERALAGENLIYTSRGELPSGEPWAYLTFAAHDEASGGGMVAFAIDITESELAQQELRRREAEVRMLVDNSPDFILRVDREGVIEFINRTGAAEDPASVVGKTVFEFTLEDDRDDARAALRRVVESGKPESFESRSQAEDGSTRFYEVRVNPLLDEEGDITSVIWIARDVTERRLAEQRAQKMNEQLQETQKLESLGLLAGGIAHDFNNLLMAILGNASLAKLDMEPGVTGEPELAQIIEASEQAAELCRQLLAYSGRGRFVVQPVSMTELVTGTARLLEVSVSKAIALKYDCPADVPAVEADISQLRQVVMNLVVNAADAIGDAPGVITLTTGVLDCDSDYLRSNFFERELPPGRYVFLEVSDTGCGMDEATKKQMFDPFFTTKVKGRGLGMAAVLGIVRGHEGALRVYSEVGRGTTIKMLLPASEQPSASAVDSKPAQTERRTGLILIVDDEPMVRDVAARTLQRRGYQTLVAADGEEALELYRTRSDKVVLVLLDLMMPKRNGADVFVELRRLNPDVKVILSSGYNEQDTTNRFVGRGLAGFIQKPYRAELLTQMVDEALDA